MKNLSELENLDITMSMGDNISILMNSFDEIKKFSNTEFENYLKIIEKKILEIEDYFCRPVDSKKVYQNLSDIFKQNGDLKRSEVYFKRIDKMDSELFEFKGRLHNFFGNNKKAMKYYEKSIEFWPENEEAQKGYKKAQKRFVNSSQQLEKIKLEARNKKNAKSYIKLGRALADIGNIEEAFQAYSKALTLDPGNDEALARKGTALESLNRFEEAVELFYKALEINPKSMIAKRGINYAEYYFSHPDSDYYKD